MNDQLRAPAALSRGKAPANPCIGSWWAVEPVLTLQITEKSIVCAIDDPDSLAVQSVVFAIPTGPSWL
jgi:hypothetical protein